MTGPFRWMAVSMMALMPVLLVACATPVPIGPLPPVQLTPSHSVWQLDVRSASLHETMLLDVESSDVSVQFVGLTPLGQKMLHLEWRIDAAGRPPSLAVIAKPPRGVDAAELMVMLQAALWPADALSRGLAAGDALIVGDGHREVRRNQHPLITVAGERDPLRIRVEYPAASLSLVLTQLEAAP